MRILVTAIVLSSSVVAAEPESPPEPPPPPEVPPAPPPEAQPAPPPSAQPPSALPPINITITNNNTGNNNNTNTATNSAPVTTTVTPTQTTTVTPTTTVAPAAAPPPLPPLVRPEVVGPGAATWAPVVLTVRRDRAERWLTVGALGSHEGGGARASIDLFGRRHFTFGIAASATGEGHHHHHGGDARGSAGAVGYIAWTKRLGRIELRAQLGLGFGVSGNADEHRGNDAPATTARTIGGGTDPTPDRTDHPHLGMRAEAALLVALPLGRHFGLVAGPVATATGGGFDDHHHDRDAMYDAGGMRDAHGHAHDSDAGFYAGIVWRR